MFTPHFTARLDDAAWQVRVKGLEFVPDILCCFENAAAVSYPGGEGSGAQREEVDREKVLRGRAKPQRGSKGENVFSDTEMSDAAPEVAGKNRAAKRSDNPAKSHGGSTADLFLTSRKLPDLLFAQESRNTLVCPSREKKYAVVLMGGRNDSL